MLQLDSEHESLPIHCLDVHCYYHSTKQCLATRLHSKRNDPKYKGLPFTRFPHPHSFISNHVLYTSFTAELHRIKNKNTFVDTFTTDIATLMNYLISKGYSTRKLKHKLEQFISNHQPFYNSTHPARTLSTIMSHITAPPQPPTHNHTHPGNS